MVESEPDRWIGFVVALGVLLPFALWFVADTLPLRVREATAVAAVLLLAADAGIAASRLGLVGYALGSGGGYFGKSEHGVRNGLLAVLGLAIGLAVSTVMLSMARPADDAEPVDADGAAGPVDTDPVDTDPVDAESSRWSSHTVERLPAATLPADAGTVTLALVALALAIPVFSPNLMSSATGLTKASPGVVAAYLLFGAMAGIGLLLPALALRKASAVQVALAFGIVALGTGISYAWADSLFNETWQMFAGGLVAGLLLPAFVRALPTAFVRDAAVIAGGVLAAVALVVLTSGVLAAASKNAIEDIGFTGDDLRIDNDNVVQVPTLPTYPGFPSGFPSDFPSVSVPTAP